MGRYERTSAHVVGPEPHPQAQRIDQIHRIAPTAAAPAKTRPRGPAATAAAPGAPLDERRAGGAPGLGLDGQVGGKLSEGADLALTLPLAFPF